MDWEKALAHFRAVRKQYYDYISEPGANTSIALRYLFLPTAARFFRGERTRELYDRMINIK